jgi:hypothetical protein
MLRIPGLLLLRHHSLYGRDLQYREKFTLLISVVYDLFFYRLQGGRICGLTAFKYDWPNVLFKFFLNIHGRFLAQIMIRWFLRVEARVQSVWDLCKAKYHSSGCFSAYFHSAYYFTNDTNPYLFHLPPSMHCNSNWQRRQRKAFSLPLNLQMDCKFITFILWIRIRHTLTLLSYDREYFEKAHEGLYIISFQPGIPMSKHLFLLTKLSLKLICIVSPYNQTETVALLTCVLEQPTLNPWHETECSKGLYAYPQCLQKIHRLVP